MGSNDTTIGVNNNERDAFNEVRDRNEPQGSLLMRLLLAVDLDDLTQIQWETRNWSRDRLAEAAAQKVNVGKKETQSNGNESEEGVVTQQ